MSDLIKPRGDRKVARMARKRKGARHRSPRFARRKTFSPPPNRGGRRAFIPEAGASANSTSSDSVVSLATSASILRTACSTVVWSRPPNRRPISGSERSVSVLARYIATWRGRTTLAVRRDDSRSERLTLYCRATTRWMSSILIRFGSCGRIRSRTSRSAISSVTGWALSLECASRRLMAPSRSRPLWVMVRAR